jgi:1,4-alpha-glucan branching enzyme
MLPRADIKQICSASHGDPFAVLGPHVERGGLLSIRAFLPGAVQVQALASETGLVLASA